MDRLTSPTAVATAAGISVPHASLILSGKRQASPALAMRLEEFAGIPRHELRPDIFDPPAGSEAACGEIAAAVASILDESDTIADCAETHASAEVAR